MRATKLILPLIVFSAYGGGDNPKGVLHYDNYARDSAKGGVPSTIKINLDESTLLDPSFERTSVQVCEAQNEFYCILAPNFEFSVPKRGLSVGGKWEYNDRMFLVADFLDISLLGQKERVYRIGATKAGNEKLEFLYSYQKGLISISVFPVSGRAVEVYWLRETHGFGRQKREEK